MEVAYCTAIWELQVPFKCRSCRLCHMSLGECFSYIHKKILDLNDEFCKLGNRAWGIK